MFDSLLVFADDWGRHPSSCQHLVRNLLPDYDVHWVNTIGTRTPRLDRATLRRGVEKLRHWTRAGDTLPLNLHVHNPKMWPWMGGRLGRRLNCELLRRQLSAAIESLAAPPVAVTTVPVVADLMGRLPVARWVYYCVDDFSQWPGLDQRTLRGMEEQVVRRADVIVAASEVLQARLAELGRESDLLTHGVDLDFWSKTNEPSPPELRGLEPPFVLFWGVIDRRMNAGIIAKLAESLNCGTIVLVGPQSNPDRALLEISRVFHVPAVPLERLPQFAAAAAVLIMPYADLPVTRAMQPLKLKEYMATGKPVVATELPSTLPWADCIDVADSSEAFCQAVQDRLRYGSSDDQQIARQRLAGEDWASKARQFAQLACGSPIPDALLAR